MLLLYSDYKYRYYDFMYVDYATYFEYFKSSFILLIIIFGLPVASGLWLFILISIVVLMASSFITMVSQTGFGDGKYNKNTL